MGDEVEKTRGFVKVDHNLLFRPDHYAVGDIAEFPIKGVPSVLEHVANARASAAHAVTHSLEGEPARGPVGYNPQPFFYSRMFEYSSSPLIWNMWGVKPKNAKVLQISLPNGKLAFWL